MSFIKFLKRTPRKRLVQVGVALVGIALVLVILNHYFKIFASTTTEIQNTATLYYTENGTEKSVQSNTVVTTVTNWTKLDYTLNLQGRSNHASTNSSLKVYPAGGTAPSFQKTDASTDATGKGSATLTDLALGSYDFQLKVKYYLSKKVKGVSLTDPTTTVAFSTLKAGDLTDDNIVNTLDFSMLSSKWLQTDAIADINQDGIVNSLDFSSLSSNWLQQGE